MVNTCALYGATTYANNWLGVNVLIILISLLVVAAVFILSNIFPIRTRQNLIEAARSELTQQFLSVVIIIVLLGAVVTACGISSSASKALTPQGAGMDPFAYATYYVGNLSMNTGLNLLSNLYSQSVSYSIESEILQSFGSIFNTKVSGIPSNIGKIFGLKGIAFPGFSIAVAAVVHLSVVYDSLSGFYLNVLAPLVVLAVGLLILQFLLIPVMQYTAFAIVLPVALAMRSLAFMGNSLRFAANTVLAIAISLYIIYPLTVSFNGYAISWIFSSSNPSFKYINSNYVVPNIPVSKYLSAPPQTSYTGFIGTAFNTLAPLVSSAFSGSTILLNPFSVVSQTQAVINQTAQFLFTAVVMILMDIAITIGFAAALTRALNSGIEGAGTFWGGI